MYHIERRNGPPLTNKEIKIMANIRTVLKNAKQVLFSDGEYFNRDIKGVRNIEDVKEFFGIKGNVYRIGLHGNNFEYKLADSDYNFTLTIIN